MLGYARILKEVSIRSRLIGREIPFNSHVHVTNLNVSIRSRLIGREIRIIFMPAMNAFIVSIRSRLIGREIRPSIVIRLRVL